MNSKTHQALAPFTFSQVSPKLVVLPCVDTGGFEVSLAGVMFSSFGLIRVLPWSQRTGNGRLGLNCSHNSPLSPPTVPIIPGKRG